MQLGIKRNAIISAVACALMMLNSNTHAATDTNVSLHATNFLAPLSTEITNRLAGTNNSARQAAALRAARNVLSHRTRTFSADLSSLATAATLLNTRFRGDATFNALETNALAAYSAEANAELDNASLRVGTNGAPRSIHNLFHQSDVLLARADRITNSVPGRARALALAFNKIRVLVAQVNRRYPVPPPPPFAAPDALPIPSYVTLYESASSPSEQTIIYFHALNKDGQPYYDYESHGPEGEELGTYTYTKTSATTAVLHCVPNFPADFTTPHDYSLTFTTATSGTFSGRNFIGQELTGPFNYQH